MEHINHLQNEVNELIELEDLKWRHKSKFEWLQHGDKNSKFFHAAMNQRHKCNLITNIKDVEGVACSDQMEVEQAFVSYFKNLFCTQRPEGLVGCLSGVERKITSAMNIALPQPCTMKEVSNDLVSMGPFKSSGPDGFCGFFPTKLGLYW